MPHFPQKGDTGFSPTNSAVFPHAGQYQEFLHFKNFAKLKDKKW